LGYPERIDIVAHDIRVASHPRNFSRQQTLYCSTRNGHGSDAWRRFCKSNHLEPSMSRKGNCWDNAVAESFFGSLKKELIKKHIYKNRALATEDISNYIETFYNRTRKHSHLSGVSPDDFEANFKQQGKGLH